MLLSIPLCFFWKIYSNYSQLGAAEARVAAARTSLNEAQAELAARDATVSTTTLRINRAQKLLSALKNEQQRWDASLQLLHSEASHVLPDTWLAAAFVSYAAPLGEGARRILLV